MFDAAFGKLGLCLNKSGTHSSRFFWEKQKIKKYWIGTSLYWGKTLTCRLLQISIEQDVTGIESLQYYNDLPSVWYTSVCRMAMIVAERYFVMFLR